MASGTASEELRDPDAVTVVHDAEQIAFDRVRQRMVGIVDRARKIGRYVLIDVVGAGAMGVVFAAYDPLLHRRVAIKQLGVRGLYNREHRLRLVGEARAMARLQHPNVVPVFEVAEDGARIFIVMEFVEGRTMTAWLGEDDRGWRTVVDRFIEAGRGLAAAHAVGLLHRDFKPDNVLVSDDGGPGPAVKVTDFGLAKPAEAATEAPMRSQDTIRDDGAIGDEGLTGEGMTMGTPLYMAPEQHQGLALTPAADQYSFCVSLWKALVGTPPFSGETLAVDKLTVRPTWSEPTTPRRIVSAIERGLAPDPDDRWPSMHELLGALAWDPARRRRRWWLGATSVGAVGLAAIAANAWAQAGATRCQGADEHLAGTWDDAARERTQAAILGIDKPYARDVWARTQRELDAYARSWAAMYVEACEASTLPASEASTVLDLRMACLRRAAQDLQAAAETLADADAQVVQNAHELTSGLRPLARCADTRALSADVEPPMPGEADAVAIVELALARATSLQRAGRYRAALQSVQVAKDRAQSLQYDPVKTEVALREGDVLDELGQYDASAAVLSDGLRLGLRLGQRDASASVARQLMHVVGYQLRRTREGLGYRPLAAGLSRGRPGSEARSRSTVALLLAEQGKLEEAEAELRAALELRERARDHDDLALAHTRGSLADLLRERGKYDEAEKQHRAVLSLREDALGAEHPHVAASHYSLAAALAMQGEFADAEIQFRAARAGWEASLGPAHPNVAAARMGLGNVLRAQNRVAQAEAEHRAALAVMIEAVGAEHPNVAVARNNLAAALRAQGKYADAEAEHRSALALREKAFGPDHLEVASSRHNLGNILLFLGRLEEAEANVRAALAIRAPVLGPDHPDVAMSHHDLAGILVAQGRLDTAEAEYRAALSSWGNTLEPGHPDVAMGQTSLAEVLLARDRVDEALPLAERAWATRTDDDAAAEPRAEAAWVLARAVWHASAPKRDRRRARDLAVEALRAFERAGPAHVEHTADVRRWLATHP